MFYEFFLSTIGCGRFIQVVTSLTISLFLSGQQSFCWSFRDPNPFLIGRCFAESSLLFIFNGAGIRFSLAFWNFENKPLNLFLCNISLISNIFKKLSVARILWVDVFFVNGRLICSYKNGWLLFFHNRLGVGDVFEKTITWFCRK